MAPFRECARAARLLLLFALAALTGACGNGAPAGKAAGPAKAGAAPGGPPAAVPARVLEAVPQRIPVQLEVVGQVEGSKEVEVRARVVGTLQKRLYNEGEPVKAGAPLFQIDAAPFEIALAQARAQLAQERARNEQARRESGRLKELAEQKAISRREYDEATSGLKLSEASMQLAEARVREAELNLSYTVVRAPLSGVSGRAVRSEGSLVTPSDSLLTTIHQISPVWARFSMAETELARLPGGRIGANTEVRLVLGDGTRYPGKGRINFAASQVDLRQGTRQMRAEFENPAGQLLPGQFVRVQVSVPRPQASFLVPQSAVLQNDKGHFVFTLDAANKAAIRPIQVGEWAGSDWVVLGGLNAGDRVVLDNVFRLQPGVAVEPLKDAQAPSPAGKS